LNEQIILVEFENVQKLDLARLPAHTRIKIFVAEHHKKPAPRAFAAGVCTAIASSPRRAATSNTPAAFAHEYV
jgi:hypothetical protein